MTKEAQPTYFIGDITLKAEGRRVGFLVEDTQGRAEPAKLTPKLLDELAKAAAPDLTSVELADDPKFMPVSGEEFEFVRGQEFSSSNIRSQTKIWRFRD